MLDPLPVRLLSLGMLLGFAVAVYALRKYGPHGGGMKVRASDNPPNAMQVLWLLATFLPNLYPLGVLLLPDAFYGSALNFSLPGGSLTQLLGLILWLAGGGLALWAARTLGRFMVIDIVVSEGHRLVQDGPYARIRHPTYTAVILLAVGLTLVFQSYVLLLFAILVAEVANYRAAKEERLLSSPEGLGEEYASYIRRTGRFLPISRRS